MGKSSVVGALDMGTSKVLAAVAAPEDAGLRVLGVAGVTCAGVRRGAVVDLAAAAASLRAAAQRIRHTAGQPLPAVLLGSAGGQVVCLNGHAEADVAAGGEIEPRDVAGVMERVRQTDLPAGYQLVHAVAQGFAVDGYEGCMEPVGMAGTRLAVKAHLVACQAAVLQNALKAADAAGLQVEDFAVSGLASAEAVLTEEERREGAVLVDLGAGAAQVVVVVSGEPVLTAAVPLGGEHVTRDIASGLRLTRTEAEDLKVQHASVDPDAVPPDRMVEVTAERAKPPGGEGAVSEVSARELSEIAAARVEEILQAVSDIVAQVGRGQRLGGGAVLTGGGSRLRGVQGLAIRILGMPVRRGGAFGAADSLAAPECAAVVGLAQMQAQRLTGGSARLLPTGEPRRLWPPWRALGLRQAASR